MNIEEVIQDVIWSNVYYQKAPDYIKLTDDLTVSWALMNQRSGGYFKTFETENTNDKKIK
jgi:hypothetical protein